MEGGLQIADRQVERATPAIVVPIPMDTDREFVRIRIRPKGKLALLPTRRRTFDAVGRLRESRHVQEDGSRVIGFGMRPVSGSFQSPPSRYGTAVDDQEAIHRRQH